MQRTLLRRLAILGTLVVLLTPGVLATMSMNHFVPAANTHPYDEITADTGTVVIRTSDTDNAIKVGLGTTAPDARLHVEDYGLAGSNDAAIHVSYGNAGSSVGTIGVKVDAKGFSDKGGEVGVMANASKVGGPDAQRGIAHARLASVTGFHAGGHVFGVYSVSTPGVLKNFDSTLVSNGLGGSFSSNPSGLNLDGVGTYWVGGVLGQAGGIVNGSAGQGASAGVIGIAAATGSAKTWAGYFKGDVKTTGDASSASVTLTPTALGMCSTASLGTMRYVSGAPDTLWMCMRNSLSVPAWKQVA